MDVNGTRFHLLLGEADWAGCTGDDGAPVWAAGAAAPTEWYAASGEIGLRRLPFAFPAPRHDRPPRPGDRRGTDVDRFGNVYCVDAARTGVDVRSVGSGARSAFWSSEAVVASRGARRGGGAFTAVEAPVSRALPLGGLVVTDDHHLVVGLLEPPGLLVLDLVSGGPPSVVRWPDPPFHPAALTRGPGGGVWVLDVAREPARAWQLGRGLTPTGSEPLVLEGAPVAVAALGDGLLVLDRAPSSPGSRLVLHRRDRPVLAVPLLGPDGLPVGGHAMTLVPADRAAGTTGVPVPADAAALVCVADAQGNQALAFTVAVRGEGTAEVLTAVLEPAFLPLRRYGGRGLATGPVSVLYDTTDGWVPLVRQPQARFTEDAVVVTPVLDGRRPGCTWHRLLVDASIRPGASLAVWSAAADDPAALDEPAWQPEPGPLPRATGPGIPFAEDLAGYDTWELLFQQARGRFLRVRLELRGDGRVSPALRALRATFPRFSYLEHYLPAVYREDEASASFLDRFLANLEGFSTGIEDTVAAANVLLDPSGTPAEALDWLAGWYGLVLDPSWSEATRRCFLQHATQLFRRRGTVRGVELALRLGLDGTFDPDELDAGPRPGRLGVRVVEAFRARRTPGVLWGDPSDLGGPTVQQAGGWTPVRGSAALDEGYRRELSRSGYEPSADERFPLVRPPGPRGESWQRFSRQVLGFVPEQPPARTGVVAAWQDFLARRYPNPSALGDAWALGAQRPSSFATVPLPEALPPDGAPLLDWYEFCSVVLPVRERAHRFTVLLPVPVGSPGAPADPHELRRRAAQVVELQKPAHTVFDVEFFWAAFRLGEARLGQDTLIRSGSRAPELLGPLVLGREHLGESYLSGPVASPSLRRPDPPSEELP